MIERARALPKLGARSFMERCPSFGDLLGLQHAVASKKKLLGMRLDSAFWRQQARDICGSHPKRVVAGAPQWFQKETFPGPDLYRLPAGSKSVAARLRELDAWWWADPSWRSPRRTGDREWFRRPLERFRVRREFSGMASELSTFLQQIEKVAVETADFRPGRDLSEVASAMTGTSVWVHEEPMANVLTTVLFWGVTVYAANRALGADHVQAVEAAAVRLCEPHRYISKKQLNALRKRDAVDPGLKEDTGKPWNVAPGQGAPEAPLRGTRKRPRVLPKAAVDQPTGSSGRLFEAIVRGTFKTSMRSNRIESAWLATARAVARHAGGILQSSEAEGAEALAVLFELAAPVADKTKAANLRNRVLSKQWFASASEKTRSPRFKSETHWLIARYLRWVAFLGSISDERADEILEQVQSGTAPRWNDLEALALESRERFVAS